MDRQNTCLRAGSCSKGPRLAYVCACVPITSSAITIVILVAGDVWYEVSLGAGPSAEVKTQHISEHQVGVLTQSPWVRGRSGGDVVWVQWWHWWSTMLPLRLILRLPSFRYHAKRGYSTATAPTRSLDLSTDGRVVSVIAVVRLVLPCSVDLRCYQWRRCFQCRRSLARVVRAQRRDSQCRVQARYARVHRRDRIRVATF